MNVSSAVVKEATGSDPDGSVRSVTIHDVLTAGQTYDTTMGDIFLQIGDGDGQKRPKTRLVDAAGKKGPGDAEFPGFKLDVDFITDRVADFTITGPFRPSTNYYLNYISKPTTDNEIVRKGIEYGNTASVKNTNLSKSFGRYLYDSAGGTISMRQGFGAFSVTKLVRGDGIQLLEDNQQYEIEAHWVLPDNKTADQYPGWTAPANPVKLKGLAGAKLDFVDTLPSGTTVTIKEPTKPVVNGVVWDAPSIAIEGGTTAQNENTFVVGNQQVANITVTNTANKNVGKFVIVKELEGDAVTLPDTYNFRFSYSCNTVPAQVATVDVPANGDPVFSPELPIGTVCTITEEDPAADPATADYTVTKAAPQEVTISHTTEINPLVFVNTYKKHQGTVKVKKTVTGVEAADTAKVPATVTLSYTVNDVEDPANVIEVPTTGAETTLPKTFDVGAKIKFKAETGAAIAGYSLDTNFGDELTVVKGDNPVVTVANTYSKDMGQVKVQKLVKGIDAALAPANVTLKYTVDGGPQQSVEVPTNGTVTNVASLPVGAKVRFVAEESTPVANYSLTTEYGDELTVVKGDNPAVVVTNTYTTDQNVVKVRKNVVAPIGDAAFVKPEKVSLTYTVDTGAGPGQPQTLTDVPTDGTEVEIGTFDVGTKVAITGETVDPVANYTNTPTYGEVTVIKADQPNVITVTNTYAKDTVMVKVKKAVEGIDAALLPANVTLNYTTNAGTPQEAKGTVSVPTNGTVTDVVALPVGAKIVFDGETGADVENYTYVANYGAELTVAKDSEPITVTNTYTKDTGVVKVKKVVEGVDAADAKNIPANVTLKYSVDGVKNDTYVVSVPTTGEAVDVATLPVGSKVAFYGETDAEVKDYDLTATTYGAEMTVAKGANEPVTVTNTYAKHKGVVKVKKAVVAPAGFTAPELVTLKYTVNGAEKDSYTVNVPTTGAEVEVGTFNVHDVVKFVSETGADVKGYTVTPALGDAVTVAKDSSDLVTVTNTYTRDTGVVKVKKVVEAPAGFTAPEKVELKYTVNGQADDAYVVSVPTNGTEVEVGTFNSGDVVKFDSEKGADVKGYSVKAAYGDAVTVEKDSSDLITVTNTYTKDSVAPVTKPAGKSSGKASVAQTGATAGVMGAAALALMAAGAVVIAGRRRR